MKSMTGYGSSQIRKEGTSVKCEIRCLNGKSMDLHIHANFFLGESELQIRKSAEEILQRGRTDIYIQVRSEDHLPVELNTALLKKYYHDISILAGELHADTQQLLPSLLRMEGVLEKNHEALYEASRTLLFESIREALKRCDEFRAEEGKKMNYFFNERLKNIKTHLGEIMALTPERNRKVRSQLEKQIAQLSSDFDRNRLEQELLYYAEKTDIQEETDRFLMHLNHLESCMKESFPGKKMIFFCQELHREINTLSNKAADAILQRHAVVIKEEIEKFREQAMNVL